MVQRNLQSMWHQARLLLNPSAGQQVREALEQGLVEGVDPSRPVAAHYQVAEAGGLGKILAELTGLSKVKATVDSVMQDFELMRKCCATAARVGGYAGLTIGVAGVVGHASPLVLAAYQVSRGNIAAALKIFTAVATKKAIQRQEEVDETVTVAQHNLDQLQGGVDNQLAVIPNQLPLEAQMLDLVSDPTFQAVMEAASGVLVGLGGEPVN